MVYLLYHICPYRSPGGGGGGSSTLSLIKDMNRLIIYVFEYKLNILCSWMLLLLINTRHLTTDHANCFIYLYMYLYLLHYIGNLIFKPSTRTFFYKEKIIFSFLILTFIMPIDFAKIISIGSQWISQGKYVWFDKTLIKSRTKGNQNLSTAQLMWHKITCMGSHSKCQTWTEFSGEIYKVFLCLFDLQYKTCWKPFWSTVVAWWCN